MPNYGDSNYWDERYRAQKNTTFDWLEGWDDLKEIIEKYSIEGLYKDEKAINQPIQASPKTGTTNFLSMQQNNETQNVNLVPVPDEQSLAIKNNLETLNLGCGNSIICEEMYDEGYLKTWNMDISQICIDQMKDRNEKLRPHMKWDVMDVMELTYKDCFFDLIVDKSTIDALLCGDQAYLNVAMMMRECQRVLKEGGYYVAISYGQPENRIFHFKRAFLHMELSTYQIQKASYEGTAPKSYHYVYILRKLPNADQVCQKNWDRTYNQIKKEIDDEQSEGDFTQSHGPASETPKSTVVKNEVTNDDQSQQSFKQHPNEADEKTYEAQFSHDYSKEPKFGSSSLQGEEQLKKIV